MLSICHVLKQKLVVLEVNGLDLELDQKLSRAIILYEFRTKLYLLKPCFFGVHYRINRELQQLNDKQSRWGPYECCLDITTASINLQPLTAIDTLKELTVALYYHLNI